MSLAVEATRRKDYFNPRVSREPRKGAESLLAASLPKVGQARELATALAIRAMLLVSEGRMAEAWRDLLACHRLGRLVARGPSIVDSLAGMAIDGIASKADLAFLDAAGPSAKQARDCLRDLRRLPPMPSLADRLDVGERLVFLDMVQTARCDGYKVLREFGDLPADLDPKALAALEAIDWSPALRDVNGWFDRLAAALRHADRKDRESSLGRVEADLKLLTKAVAEMPALAKLLKDKKPDKAVAREICHTLMGLPLPAARKVQQSADRVEQTHRNLHVAFALAAYRCDHGRYPEKLDALAPKYLAAVPDDLFSGKPLIYKPNEKGYLLYSVGVNGKDEEGRSYGDTPAGDDLNVRIHLPKGMPK